MSAVVLQYDAEGQLTLVSGFLAAGRVNDLEIVANGGDPIVDGNLLRLTVKKHPHAGPGLCTVVTDLILDPEGVLSCTLNLTADWVYQELRRKREQVFLFELADSTTDHLIGQGEIAYLDKWADDLDTPAATNPAHTYTDEQVDALVDSASGALALDQTVPQTVSGGAPNFSDGLGVRFIEGAAGHLLGIASASGDINGEDLYIGAGEGSTGTGGDVVIASGMGGYNGGNVTITAADNSDSEYPDGEGGEVTITAGDGTLDGGGLYLAAGSGESHDGGGAEVHAGDGVSGGNLSLVAGRGITAEGGPAAVYGGQGDTTGGDVGLYGGLGGTGAGGNAGLYGGDSDDAAGGDIDLVPGSGVTDGKINAVGTLIADQIGIGTTAPLRALDINEATGNCLRLIYNDADGSAVNYADFLVNSTGDLSIMPTRNVGIGTITPAKKLDVAGAAVTGTVAFTGAGLNDATLSGTYTGSWTQTLRIKIDGTGSPNTFTWSIDGGSTWVETAKNIVAGAIALNYTGISVTFAATTGHTLNDYWQATLSAPTGIANTSGGYYLGNALFATAQQENTIVGLSAMGGGKNTGRRNTANGYYSLYSNTTGSYNTANGMYSLNSNTTGSSNTANGMQALFSNTTGNNNTANGMQALYSNTTGNYNTANGMQALYSNTTGNYNTANGMYSLYSNTTGSFNTANGYQALYSNTTGIYNTANGMQALNSNTTGNNNTANGYQTLYSNTTGNYNTANGYQALYSNTTGSNNTANGMQALYSNTTGNYNTANGMQALNYNTTGSSNTANGYAALFSNTTGSQNTANGYYALFSNTTGSQNTANGYAALNSNTTGSSNTANGMYALLSNTTGSNNTANGMYVLFSNTTGIYNTANGYQALYYNTTGSYNTANGYQAMGIYPAQPTSAIAASGQVDAGAHNYTVTYVLNGIEHTSQWRTGTTTLANGTVNLSGISVYSGPQAITYKRLYRTLMPGGFAGTCTISAGALAGGTVTTAGTGYQASPVFTVTTKDAGTGGTATIVVGGLSHLNTEPTWNTTTGAYTLDNKITWICSGAVSGGETAWTANTTYTVSGTASVVKNVAGTHKFTAVAGGILSLTCSGGSGYTVAPNITITKHTTNDQFKFYKVADLALGDTTYSDTQSDIELITRNAPLPTGMSNTVLLGINATGTGSSQFVLGDSQNPVSDSYFGGVFRFDAGAGLAHVIHGMGGNGTDRAGGNLTIAGGKGTGTGTGGSLIFQTAPAAVGTGSGENTLVTALTITSNKDSSFAGRVASTNTAVTVTGAATTFAVASNVVKVTGDAGGNTVSTITGGLAGQMLVLIFIDDKVTITDDNSKTANTVNLSAAFTSAANTTLSLVFDGVSWYETARSVNG